MDQVLTEFGQVMQEILALLNQELDRIAIVPTPLTQERRRELLTKAHHFSEAARTSIGSRRRGALAELEELVEEAVISQDDAWRGDQQIEQLNDSSINLLNDAIKKKEQQILAA